MAVFAGADGTAGCLAALGAGGGNGKGDGCTAVETEVSDDVPTSKAHFELPGGGPWVKGLVGRILV